MKRTAFLFFKWLSFMMRPLRHGFYIRILQYAYKLQGIKFSGKASYIHHDAFIDNLGKIEIGENVVISTKAILLAHDYSPKIKQMLMGGEKRHSMFLLSR